MNTTPPSSVASGLESGYLRENPWNDDRSDSGFESVKTTTTMDESHPRYVPPHRRDIRKDMGDEVVVAAKENTDQTGLISSQGVEHRHHEKLLVRVPYALTKDKINVLTRMWPGVFFASTAPGNHDHPIAHANTMVATRMMQRMFPRGARILDLFGNPNACDKFNASQAASNDPKTMRALVNPNVPADFIRAVNKWGPMQEPEGGDRYDVGRITDFDDDYYRQFTHFQLTHALYYLSPDDVVWLLHRSGGPKKMLALVHSHQGDHGFLNGGEQEFWIRGGAVKQKNVISNTCYYHKDVTPFWFGEKKEYWSGPDEGITWEVNFQSDGTWVIEIVTAWKSGLDTPEVDWEAKFRSADAFSNLNTVTHDTKTVTELPTPDGAVLKLSVQEDELLEVLKRKTVGKSRRGAEGKKLFKDLVQTAVHKVNPGSLFPDQAPLPIPAGRIIDYVICSWVSGVDHEMRLADAVSTVTPLLAEHAGIVNHGFSSSTDLEKLLDLLRTVAPHLKKVVPGGGAVDSIVAMLEEAT